jgi:putrescine transport system permease protein
VRMAVRSLIVVGAMVFAYAFLYAPVAALVAYSFNASDRVTVWGGFSMRWYGELLRDQQILSAAWLSLQIAAASATLATALGTLAAFALARLGRFRGRGLCAGMLAAPLVLPEVVFGLALLLLFVTLEQATGWPAGRGALTIAVAHVTFALAYVAVVVRARLARFDRSLEEAALDLGARPAKVFLAITLPLIAPALAAGWLLAFTLSLDDLVVASFVSGPGASTLPIVVFSKVRLGLSPEVNALASIVVAAVLLVALATAFIGRGRRD